MLFTSRSYFWAQAVSFFWIFALCSPNPSPPPPRPWLNGGLCAHMEFIIFGLEASTVPFHISHCLSRYCFILVQPIDISFFFFFFRSLSFFLVLVLGQRQLIYCRSSGRCRPDQTHTFFFFSGQRPELRKSNLWLYEVTSKEKSYRST